MPSTEDGPMTLVFSLAALCGLERPADAVADAGQWSEHVGVVSDAGSGIEDAVERLGASPDFVAGQAEISGSLAAIRQRFGTDRHVFVATTAPERATARALGWETLSLDEAADAADWPTAAADEPD